MVVRRAVHAAVERKTERGQQAVDFADGGWCVQPSPPVRTSAGQGATAAQLEVLYLKPL